MSSPAAQVATAVVPTWTIGDKLRKIRRDVLGIEQSEFAERLEVTRQRYAAWESGRTQPRDLVAVARRVELLSGVPAAWLLGLSTPQGSDSIRNSPRNRRSVTESAQVIGLDSRRAAATVTRQCAGRGGEHETAA